MESENTLEKPQESRESALPTPNVVDAQASDSTSDIWQNRLLPLMVFILAALTALFFTSSFYQYYQLQKRTEDSALVEAQEGENQLRVDGLVDADSQLELAKWQSLLVMERSAIKRRYHQANILLMARIWIKYLGFITGMTLALVGATFILGKLRESEARLAANSAWWKFSMTTASPGLLLAVLGTVLMVTTLVVPYEIQVNDAPLYLLNPTSLNSPAAHKDLPEPQRLERQSDDEIIQQGAEILHDKGKPKSSPSQ